MSLKNSIAGCAILVLMFSRPMTLQCFVSFTNKKQSKPLQWHWTIQREDQRISNGLSFRPSLSHEMCTLKITQSIDLYACGCCNNNVHHLLRFWVLLSLNARHNSGMKKSTALCKVSFNQVLWWARIIWDYGWLVLVQQLGLYEFLVPFYKFFE